MVAHVRQRLKRIWLTGRGNGKREETEQTSSTTEKGTLWPLAKVVEIYPSLDGQIRVVKIKTSKGELQRAVKKLISLEIRQYEEVPTLGLSNTQRNEIENLKHEEKDRQTSATCELG